MYLLNGVSENYYYYYYCCCCCYYYYYFILWKNLLCKYLFCLR